MKWWEKTVFYQIYPRSFADANGDGIGDIRGIIQKLDYLQDLGIGGIWLSPHYPSPQIDVGYDISDYIDVNPEYGTLADFREFLEESHKRGIRVILDMVLNHTSDQHQWFQESKSSRTNPKRDWYVWLDGVDGNPPNNWEAIFGGSAWQYDETTGQYYYHYFLKEQPDLNWRNPEVQKAMFDACRFWLKMGVDGLRLDAIGTIYEDSALPNHKSHFNAYDVLKAFWLGRELDIPGDEVRHRFATLFQYQHDLPETVDLMAALRKVSDEFDDKFLVGETSDLRYLGTDRDILHSIFNFDLVNTNKLSPKLVRENQAHMLPRIPQGTAQSNTLNNHDQSRVRTHFGDGQHDIELAKISAALVLLLEGIPFLYYGEEIGMEDYAVQSFEEVRDMVSAVYRDIMQADGVSDAKILADLAAFSRDRCRTPMQWDNSANAGFSPAGIQTWLPVHANYKTGVNVAEQAKDPNSLLNFYKKLLAVRKANLALVEGEYVSYPEVSEHFLAFLRKTETQTCLVLLNFSTSEQTVSASGKVLFSTVSRADHVFAPVTLSPFEILVLEL